jgi:hypothetical protein
MLMKWKKNEFCNKGAAWFDWLEIYIVSLLNWHWMRQIGNAGNRSWSAKSLHAGSLGLRSDRTEKRRASSYRNCHETNFWFCCTFLSFKIVLVWRPVSFRWKLTLQLRRRFWSDICKRFCMSDLVCTIVHLGGLINESGGEREIVV